MSKLKNEDGYALVIVLFMITIFMTLFLAFAGQSINTMKQNQVVEKQSQATAVAEMGVTYYQTLVNNIYLAKRNVVNTEIVNFIKNNPNLSDTRYKEEAIKIMTKAINDGLLEKKKEVTPGSTTTYPILINLENGASVTIESVPDPSVIPSDAVSLFFKVTGKDGKTASLSGSLKMGITLEHSDSSTGTSQNVLPTLDDLTPPTIKDEKCRNSGTILDNCPDILLEATSSGRDYKEITGNNNGTSRKTVFSTVPLYINAPNNNHLDNLDFLSTSTGLMQIDGNIKHVSSLTIKTKGSLKITQQFEPESSNIYILNNFTATGNKTTFNKGTFVYVGGNADIQTSNGSPFTIDSSIMCIKGTLSSNKTPVIKNGGQLIVNDNKTPPDDNFLSKCGVPPFEPPSINWQENIARDLQY